MNPCKERVRRRRGYKGEIVKERLLVDRTSLIRILKQSFDFRCEGDPSMMKAVIQRLNAYPVADEPQPACLSIPERNGEHAAKSLQTFDAPLFKSLKDNLGIRVIRLPPPVSVFF